MAIPSTIKGETKVIGHLSHTEDGEVFCDADA